MKYCRHCGSEMQDKAAICIKCGVAANTTVTGEKAYCMACGAEIDKKAAVCLKCGVSQTGKTVADKSGGSMRRVREGKVLSGVCSGLGAYTNMNPWVFRAILIILNFFVIGFLLDIAYIIAIFAIPYED